MDALLKVEGISRNFGGVVAANKVTMSVRPGSITGLIGPNGAGKTTIFNIISGFCRPTEGAIRFADEECTHYQPHRIAGLGISRTFQMIRLFPGLSVLENVLTGMHRKGATSVFDDILRTRRRATEERDSIKAAINTLKLLKMDDKLDAHPYNLPYGEQRKVEIARALVNGPLLLLLDEPAAGMNEAETEWLGGFIQSLKASSSTVLLIEHDMKLVMRICDYIYVLDHGSLIAEGTPGEIQQDEKVIEAYLGKGV